MELLLTKLNRIQIDLNSVEAVILEYWLDLTNLSRIQLISSVEEMIL